MLRAKGLHASSDLRVECCAFLGSHPLRTNDEVSMSAPQLRARAALRWGHGRWLVPPWIAPAFLLCAVVLLPWTAFLFFALPQPKVQSMVTLSRALLRTASS